MDLRTSILVSALIVSSVWARTVSAQGPSPSSPWLRVESPRFEIHYQPALGPDVSRVTRSAERADDVISERLKFVLGTKVPLVMCGPPDETPREAVVAYAVSDDVAPQHPHRSRIVLPVPSRDADLDASLLHELTHLLFGEIILPSQPGTGGVPRWVQEGLATYMVGQWSEADTSLMRALATSNHFPVLSRLASDGSFERPRVNDVLGHAVFDYIESRWGRTGIRAFVDGLIVPRRDRTYDSVLGLTPAEFDDAFRQYAMRRFGTGMRREDVLVHR